MARILVAGQFFFIEGSACKDGNLSVTVSQKSRISVMVSFFPRSQNWCSLCWIVLCAKEATAACVHPAYIWEFGALTWGRRGVPDHQEDRAEETKPITPEKVNQETQHTKQNETKHIKIPPNQHTDEIVDVSIAMQRKSSQIQPVHRRSRTKRPDKWI